MTYNVTTIYNSTKVSVQYLLSLYNREQFSCLSWSFSQLFSGKKLVFLTFLQSWLMEESARTPSPSDCSGIHLGSSVFHLHSKPPVRCTCKWSKLLIIHVHVQRSWMNHNMVNLKYLRFFFPTQQYSIGVENTHNIHM